MNNFAYSRVENVGSAVREISSGRRNAFIAGGTNLIDLIKENVARPERLIDISRLPLSTVAQTEDGGLRLGAMATNSEVAYHDLVERAYPLLSRAILAGASAQLRNMATTGGNLLQRTRCCYFYDVATPCNKREPGAGCAALEGFNRMHAILGGNRHCIAVHPSDMCVALAALEAMVEVEGHGGQRLIPFADFHRLPGDTPNIDTNLRRDEIVTAVILPRRGFAEHYAYLKIRDRASYAFALVSVAVGLEMERGKIAEARITLGGVAHKPWRQQAAERLLQGKPASKEQFGRAADVLLAGAIGRGCNDFKIPLARRAIIRALSHASAMGGNL